MQSGMKDRRVPTAGTHGHAPAQQTPAHPLPSKPHLAGGPPTLHSCQGSSGQGGPCVPLSPQEPLLRGLTSAGAGMCSGHPKSRPHRGSRSPWSPGRAPPFILDFLVLTTLFLSSHLVTCHLPEGCPPHPLHPAPSPTGLLPQDSPD